HDLFSLGKNLTCTRPERTQELESTPVVSPRQQHSRLGAYLSLSLLLCGTVKQARMKRGPFVTMTFRGREPMAKNRIGKRPPQYSFILNPYSDVRLSKCPKCERPTHPRKFALVIHIQNWGPLVLGKTCRYCTRCQLIIAHQDELEAEMATC